MAHQKNVSGERLMRCPKCGYLRRPDDALVHEGTCPACGIAYQKWLARQLAATDGAQKEAFGDTTGNVDEYDERLLPRLIASFTAVPDRVDPVAFWSRALLLVVLAQWWGRMAMHGIDWEIIGGSFMHNINLAFHEFGHVLFRPFGELMLYLGGSLFQILLPLVPLAVFTFQQQDNFAASLMLAWCGQNFIDVAPYIRDAEYRVLPLVGGAGEENHDWGNILEILDAVDNCYALSTTSFGIGVIVMLAGFSWGVYILWLQYRVMQH